MMKLEFDHDTPPANYAAERQLLGALLVNNGLMDKLTGLEPKHFADEANRRIFELIQTALASGDAAKPVLLLRQVASDAAVQASGGQNYVAQLMAEAPFVAPYIGTFAKEIRAQSLLREIRYACNEALSATANGEKGPEEIAAHLAKQMEAIMSAKLAAQTRDDLQVTQAILDDLTTQRDVVSTGLAKLDTAMGGGLHAGRAYGIAARKKVGKTTLASTISYNLNRDGVKHLFICGEMSDKEIHQRNLARELRVKPFSFKGDYGRSPEFHRRIADAAIKSNRCIIYQNAPGLTFDDLRRFVVTAVHTHKIQGIILDYWQLVGGKGKKSTSEHLDEVAQWVADFGRKHGLWSITMAQINQEGNTRGGEGIRLAFDQVYQLHRDDVTMPQAWLEMMDTRYTAWMNIGSEAVPGLIMNDHGPYFEEF